MALYSISYVRPGEKPAIHELGAKSDAEAKIRFLNLSWVAFTEIQIVSIAIAADQPEEAKVAAREASAGHARPRRRVPASIASIPPKATQPPNPNWRKEVGRLTIEIAKLADEAQKLTRKERHEEADALRAEAKRYAAERAAITKRNKGK